MGPRSNLLSKKNCRKSRDTDTGDGLNIRGQGRSRDYKIGTITQVEGPGTITQEIFKDYNIEEDGLGTITQEIFKDHNIEEDGLGTITQEIFKDCNIVT